MIKIGLLFWNQERENRKGVGEERRSSAEMMLAIHAHDSIIYFVNYYYSAYLCSWHDLIERFAKKKTKE